MWSIGSVTAFPLRSFRPAAAICTLLRNDAAGVATMFGLLTPILFAVSAAAVEYSMYQRHQTRLQSQVDAAAIASVREMQMARADRTRISAVAENYVHVSEPEASVETQVDLEKFSVTVAARKQLETTMGKLFWVSGPSVEASATAKLNGTLPLCLLALDRKAPGAVHLEQSATMTAPGCMVYSNSKHASGVQAKDNATLKAGFICSAGGKGKTTSATFTPEPVTDCPQMDDPLRGRNTPPDSPCRFKEMVVNGGTQTLQPGVYCKGLKITNGAKVRLTRGVYVIKDGPLIVNRGGELEGTDVAIYLKGRTANLVFETNSTINLSAPKDGPLAGILIFDDPSGASAPAIPPYPLPLPIVGAVLGLVGGALEGPPREHKILSDNARTLLGTIYMPQGRLIIDASRPIADKSAYTVLVVRQIDLHAGPNLFLNSDYSASDVPVPKGVGPYGSNIMLTN